MGSSGFAVDPVRLALRWQVVWLRRGAVEEASKTNGVGFVF